MLSPLVFDIETFPLEDAARYLEPVQPARNLVDPIKIAADIAERTQKRDEKLALDWNVARIAAMAWWTAEDGTMLFLGRDEAHEESALVTFWSAMERRTLIGFNCKGFDLRFCIRRSQLLGLQYPRLDLGKYGRSRIIDLYLELTFNDGVYDQGAMKRTLSAFCRRFGIEVPEGIEAKEVPLLAAAGEWDAVLAKVHTDLELTRQLAQRLGFLVGWDLNSSDEGGGRGSLDIVSHGHE